MNKIVLERSVSLMGSIDEKTIPDLIKRLVEVCKKSKGSWVTFFITSNGGLIAPAFAAYEYIATILKPKLQTISLGSTNSMAPILFMAGDHRIVGKYSFFYFHHLGTRYEQPIRLDTNDYTSLDRDFKYYEKMYIEILCSRSGGKLSERRLRGWMKDSKLISPDECVKYGLAHEKLP